MNVLLVYPEPDVAPFYLQPAMGVFYLAAALEERHSVRIYDANVDEQRLDSVVAEFAPDVIGVSFTTGCVNTSFRIAEQFGKDGRIMIAGGFHPTYKPKECIDAGFDIVARGEVEDTLPDVLDHLNAEHPFVNQDFTLPPGYFFKNGDEHYVDTGIARCMDVDRFTPARHLVPEEYHNSYTHGLLVGSRGCHYSCVFCGAGHTGYRQRAPKKVVDEFEYIVRTEGHEEIHFADDIFTHDPKWVKEICQEIIARKIECGWSVNSRSDIPAENWDIFDWMKRAGCKFVLLGIESGHQKSLKIAKKALSVKKIQPVTQRIREAGLKIRSNLMVGLPGATYDDHLESIDLMEAILPNQITLSLCTPYPGTELYDNPELYGIRFKSSDWTALFQRDYIDVGVEKFAGLIEYRDISAEEIFQFAKTLQERLEPYGYTAVNGTQKLGSKMIKTYLDKPKLLPIRRETEITIEVSKDTQGPLDTG